MSELVIPPSVPAYSTGFDVSSRDMKDLFPDVDPGVTPFGHRVLVQLRRVVNKSAGGIILAQVSKDTEAWNINVAKLIAIGPLAFRKRDTMEPWPEGVWASPGDYVRVPKYGGDRWSIDLNDELEPVALLLLNDSDLLGRVTGDPRAVRAYVS